MRLTIGSQRSYSDVCRLTGGTLDKAGKAIQWLDKGCGVIRCEAGATLYDVIAAIHGDGWSLPVVPGTGWATVGGCIANDVHGKNQATHGTFGNWVLDMNLMPVPAIGGLGLTGTIKWAYLQLERKWMVLPYLFPLDYTPYWRMVRRLQLKQYQCVVPRMAVKTLLCYMPPPLLMSRKEFGTVPSKGMLSFARKGVAFALDYLPGTDTSVLDKVVTDCGGAVNPSKTSMSQAMFRHSFPRWKEFSRFVDPGYSSDFWARVNSPP